MFPFYKHSSHIRLGTALVQHDLILTSHICENPIPCKVTFWELSIRLQLKDSRGTQWFHNRIFEKTAFNIYIIDLSVQFSRSVVSDSLWPHESQHARPPCPSITNSQGLLKLMSIVSVMPESYLILCHPLLLLPSIFPSIKVFSNESALSIRWPKYWSFSFNISPSNEHLGLTSFRMHWLDLLAVQGTLKSLLQYHSSEASVLQRSAFFIVQLSHPYMTTGKITALTRWIFVYSIRSWRKSFLLTCFSWC